MMASSFSGCCFSSPTSVNPCACSVADFKPIVMLQYMCYAMQSLPCFLETLTLLSDCRLQASIGGVLATIIPRARIVPAVKGEDMSTDPQAVSLRASAPKHPAASQRWCTCTCFQRLSGTLSMHGLQVQEMEEDPLNASGNVRARTGNEFLKAFRRVFEREHELQLPIYAHHGAGDRLANLSVSCARTCAWRAGHPPPASVHGPTGFNGFARLPHLRTPGCQAEKRA